MAGFDGNAGAEATGLAGSEGYGFETEDVVAEVFTGMSDRRQTGARIKQFYAKHMSMVAEPARSRRSVIDKCW
jgi:hypothetical protein